MKKLLQFTLFSVSFFLFGSASAQSSGIFESFAILSINGGANSYYDMQATTTNPDLQGANLGSFAFGVNTLVVKGGQNKTFKNGGCNINGSSINYRVYPTATPAGSYLNINEPFGSDLGGGDQLWEGTTGTTNAIAGLLPGSYTIEVYSQAGFDSCGTGTHFSSNGGANYKATFTIVPNPALPIIVTSTTGTATSASYATVAAAVTAINGGAIHTGTIVCYAPAGHTEIAPVGGISITATGTVSAPITFVKSGTGANPTITANTALVAGSLVDAIFKIIGGDYITIDGFTMLENANTTVAAASNNMTEFGVALFYATTTNGCQNITIKNCTIDLNRIYQNTWGIYANSTHSATAIATGASATGVSGGNHNLTITGNTITDVNQGISIIGPLAAVDYNTSVVIGGSALNANTITNFGTTNVFSGYVNVSGTVNGVLVRNTLNTTISNNSITSSVGGVVAGGLNGIQIPASSVAPTGTFNVNINNNSISLKSGLIAGAMNGINLPSGSATATSVLNVTNNDFNNFGHTVAGTGVITFILNAGTHLTQSISNNTFTNMSVNTTGSVTFISNSNTVAAGGSQNMNSNSIITGFNKTGAGGTVTFMTSAGSSPSGVTSIWNLNNFSNVTVTGATTIAGITSTDGGTVNHNITNNTITNITGGTSSITAINSSFGGGGGSLGNVVSGNIINTISSAGQITGVAIGGSGTISSVFNNRINGLISTGAFPVQGITSSAPTSNSIYLNKIYNLEANNASGTVNGITVSGGTLHTIYNNVVGDLRTPLANAAIPLAGINITGGTTSNVYHNSVILNATSAGALFGSSAFYATTAPVVTLRNNIFINNSTPVGATGFAAAYRRSGLLTVANYPAVSDNNIFYAGTPSANNVIFYDGTTIRSTIADYITFVATRDLASQTENVAFISTNGASADFLRIALGTTSFAESGGALVSTPLINTDYWNVTRPFVAPVNGGTAVDIGASEFDGIPNLVSCVAPSNQATAYVAGAVTSNSAAATFTAAASAPTGYLVITSQGAFTGSPVNGTVYAPGAALGNGAVIQSNATTSINAVGLPSNTVGTITIFSYNSGSCAGGPKYNLVSPLTGTNTTCAGAATLPVTNGISATGFTANWTQAALGNAFPITYSVEVTTDAAYTLPIVGSPFTTIALSQVITGLNPQTNYYWRVIGNNTICNSAYLNAGLVTTDCAAISVYPSVEPFATYLPSVCWKEGDLGDLVAGPSVVSATASSWAVDGFLNSGTTGAASLNIFSTADSDWLLTPYYTIPATGYRVKYNVGATNFGATSAVTNWEADDFVQLLVSTTGTTNWTVLRTYNNTNVPSNLGQIDESDLTPYAGQTIRFAFRGVEGATDGVADLDFFVDNFTVEIIPIAITVSSNVAICNGTSTTLTVTSANPNYVYTWSPATGLNVTTGSSVIATPTSTTTYTVNAVDGGMNNSGTVTVVVNPNPAASVISSNTPVCEGTNLNLTSSTVALPGYSLNSNSGIAFTDISTTGTSVGVIGDDTEHNITIPSFTYNGVAYTTARIGNNGVLVFGATTGDIIYSNSSLPQGIASGTTATTGIITGAGNSVAAICANWDDMIPSATAGLTKITTQTVGGMYIIQWTSEDNFNATGTGTITFQIQLEIATGKINLVYPDITYGAVGYDGGQSATIGLNFSATSAQQYSFNTSSLVDGQSLTFSPNLANYSWSGPNSFTSTIQNPTISAVTTAAAGAYTLTVTNPVTGCFNTSTTNVFIKTNATIVTQPVSQTVCQGTSVTFSVVGGNSTAFLYQWNKNGVAINTAVNSTYTIPSTSLTDAGSYTVEVVGDCGPLLTSNIATLTVNPINVITNISAAITTPICYNATTTLTANGVSGTNTTVTWYSGTNGTGTNLGTGLTLVAGPGTYYARVTGDCGSPVESNYTINFIPGLVYANLQFPGTATICQTGTLTAFGKVYKAGVTDAPGQGAGITVEFGYDTSNTNPNTWTNWSTASYQGDLVNDDEYTYTFAPPTSGTFYYTFRYTNTGCTAWQYGGYSASGGDIWDGVTFVSGVLTVNSLLTPAFASVAPLCSGDTTYSLPLTSTNGITGTWAPAFDNLNSGTYTFTPSAGQCATTATLAITITPQTVPAFASVAPLCSGDISYSLPLTSSNGVTGTWSPAYSNTASGTYTFTPTSGQCATTAMLTITIGGTTTWTGVTWDNGAPTSTSTAIIAANYSETADITACSLTVNNNAVVSVPSGNNVTLNGALTVVTGSTFTLNNNSNLLQASNASNTGDIIIKRTTPAIMRQDYVLWSSPVASQNLLAFSPQTLLNRFNTYNPTTNLYEAVVSPSSTNFATGAGYLIRVRNNHPTTPTTWTGTFTGVPNNGPVSLTVANNTYNAIGNPYPSAISADAFMTANNSAALYFWRKTNNTNNSSYASYTGAGGVANSGGDPLNLIPNGNIQVGQGFLVNATSTSLSFTNAMRVTGSGPMFRATERSRIWLDMTSTDGIFSQTMVAYMTNATSGIDNGIDGLLISDATNSTLSSLVENQEYAIQGRALPFENTDVVPMAFKSGTAGSYTIGINHVDGLFNTTGQAVYIQDNLTNTVHNLATPYNFVTEAGVFNSRFQIVYQPTGTLATTSPTLNDNNVIVYKQDENVVINTGTIEMANVKIFDIRGRLLIEKSNINASNIKLNSGSTNQVLIVKITSKTNEVVTKKIIN